MCELRLVALSDDGSHLVLSGGADEPPEGYRLPVDERLRQLVNRRGSDEPPAPLSPREIQARLRAGESVEDIAAAAGAPVARIEPYAAPVLDERARVLDDALAAFMSRPRHGPSVLPLRRAVAARLGTRDAGTGLDWHAWREPDTGWVVELRYSWRGRPRAARWRWDRAARSLTALDATAAELGHVEHGWTPRPARSAVRVPADGSDRPPADHPIGPIPVGDELDEPAAASAAAVGAEADGDPGPPPGRVGRPSRARRAAVPSWADMLLGRDEPGRPGGDRGAGERGHRPSAGAGEAAAGT